MGTNAGSVLIVDDDLAVGKVLSALLEQAGYSATHVDGAKQALERLGSGAFDLVVSDLRMPEMDGIALLRTAREKWPDVPVIMLTAFGSVSTAVDCMKAGAADFLTKPFDRDEILYVVSKVMLATSETRAHAPKASIGVGSLVGSSPAMEEVYAIVRQAAASNSTVLLLGESGTGKELVADALHQLSPRAAKPFVKVHCAALPDNLLESELFGYEKGAFTGAVTRKPGRVELAEGGTLFLDEIGDITPAMQVKLLRVLQDRQYERLGGTQTLRADVRFVAATNRNLEERVSSGEFREDLYYRLNVVPIWLPALRERPSDIASLAVHFCSEVAQSNGRPSATLSAEAVQLLAAQPWPGNVRQLHNFVERLVVLSSGPVVDRTDVQRELSRRALGATGPDSTRLEVKRDDAERDALASALQRTGNNRTQAARLLGVSRRTLYNKLEKLGLG